MSEPAPRLEIWYRYHDRDDPMWNLASGWASAMALMASSRKLEAVEVWVKR
jgi:hypothetical protein